MTEGLTALALLAAALIVSNLADGVQLLNFIGYVAAMSIVWLALLAPFTAAEALVRALRRPAPAEEFAWFLSESF